MDSQNRNPWMVAVVVLAVIYCGLNYYDKPGKLRKLFAPFFSGSQQDEVTTPSPAAERKPLDWKVFNENARQWLEAVLVSDYEKNGKHSAAWDAKARALFTTYAQFRFPGVQNPDVLKQLKSQADELMALGCEDPYITYIQANALYQTDGAKQALPAIKHSMELLEDSPYPAMNQFYAARRLQLAYAKTGVGGEDMRDTIRKKMRYLGQAAADTSFDGGHQRYYISEVLDQWGPNCRMPDEAELLLREVENTVGADPWIKLMVQGLYHNSRGWEARGGDVSSFVKDKGHKIFLKELQLARACFTKAQELHPEFPEAAAWMITVTMADGSSEDEQRQWFDRAVAAHFDYHPAYDSYLWALRPRWGGSQEQMLQFGVECLKSRRFDTEIPRRFLRVLWEVGSELPDWREPYRAPGTFENLEIFFNGIVNEPAQYSWLYYWKTVQAVTYWAANRYEESKRVLDELGKNAYEPACREFLVSMDQVIGENNLRTGPLQDSFLQAEKLYADDQSLEALPYYEKLREGLQSDTKALLFINDRITTLILKANYLKGEWFDLMPASGLAGWDNKGGDWTIEADGALKGASSQYSDVLLLVGKFPVTGNYELRGEIEASYKGGVALGYTRGSMSAEYVAFSIETSANKTTLSEHFYYDSVSTKEIAAQERNRFLLHVADGRVTAFINGVEVFKDQKTDHYEWSPHGGVIGLGDGYWRIDGQIVRYRGMQMRRIGD